MNTIEFTKDLFTLIEPQITIGKDNNNNKYLCIVIAEDRYINPYLCVKISDDMYNNIINEKIDIDVTDTIYHPYVSEWYIVDYNNRKLILIANNIQNVDSEYLPSDGLIIEGGK